MGYLIIDYIISFVVLIVIHAPWWAWLIYVVGAVVWLVTMAMSDDSTNRKTTDNTKLE